MKTSITVLTGLLILIAPMSLWAGGTVVDTTIVSPSLGFDRDVRIYLPEGYHADEQTRYPVVYFLHGASVSYGIYWVVADLRATLDTLIDDGTIMPIIFVTPDGSIGSYWGSFYTNSALYGQFENFIVDDLPASIDTTYRTRNSRNFRAIMGHSMGGYGCMKAALKHPDVYCAVASHSGVLGLHLFVDQRRGLVMAENSCPTCPPYDYDPEAGVETMLMFTQAGAFSPNLENFPNQVDFPLDPEGELDPEVMERWHPHDPPHLAEQLPPDSDLAIYFDCGLQDERGMLPLNDAFADSLDALGLPYEYQTYPGNHSDEVIFRVPIALAFLNAAFQTVAVPTEQPPFLPYIAVYPNPFNPQTTITFTLDRDEWATVNVFELTGRRVTLLADRTFDAGTHALTWSGSDEAGRAVPSGTYVVRLETASGMEARKVMLLR